MKEDWIALGEYFDKKLLLESIRLLKQEEIPAKVESSRNFLHSAYGTQNMQPDILYVPTDLLDKADRLLKNQYPSDKQEIDMSDYSDDELADIMENQYEWHADFVLSAEKEQKRRNLK